MLFVVNQSLEPATYITSNAMTTLCGEAFYAKNYRQVASHMRGAVLFCVLLTLPIGGLLLGTPALLALLPVPTSVLGHAAEYAPAYALVVTPALLLSVLLGFLRAQGQLRSTAIVCFVAAIINGAAAAFAVPALGVRGSALCTAAVRLVLLLLLAAAHRRLLAPAAGAVTGGGGVRGSLVALLRLYGASLLPATLRTGVAQLLTPLALLLGAGAVEAACVPLSVLLLTTGIQLSMGLQQATLIQTARYLSRQRLSAARHAMRVAGWLLLASAVAVGAACFLLRRSIGALFGGDERLVNVLDALSWYIAPTLLLRSASGLYGQFLALSGRGGRATLILFVVHGCLGLPAAYAWAALGRGAAIDATAGDAAAAPVVALMQAHTAAWLLAASCFCLSYLCTPPHVWPAQSAATAPLSAPLLNKGDGRQDAQPAA